MDESLLCTAMAYSMGSERMNETLESLEVNDRPSNENFTMWRRALSFLRTDKALKSLDVILEGDETESGTDAESMISAFRIDINCGHIYFRRMHNSRIFASPANLKSKPRSGGGKPEQASANKGKGKECRRRLA
jgi:hypothetical protein